MLLVLLGAWPTRAQTFWAAGISLLPQSSPKPDGFAAYSTAIDAKDEIYTYSIIDFAPAPTRPVRLMTTIEPVGTAKHFRDFGPIQSFLLLAGGVATSGTATTGAGSGGVMFRGPLGKSGKWRWYAAFQAMVGGNAVQNHVYFGVGQ